MNRSGLLLFLSAAIIAIAITWLNNSWLSYQGYRFTQKIKKIDYYLSDFTLLKTQPDGQMRYLITAQHLIHQQSTGRSEIFEPQLQASDSDGTLITVKSAKAEQDEAGILHLAGDVSVVKKSDNPLESFELITRDLNYNPNEKTLSSKSAVTFTSHQGSLQGVGFSSKLDEQELRIHSHVQSQFKPAQ